VLLYVNGDSHTAPEYSYAALVAREFDYSLINQAQSGCSNDSIIRRTKEYLSNTKPDFIIIGWSTWEREEWHIDNEYYNVNSSGHDVLPNNLKAQYKSWVKSQNTDTLTTKSKKCHQDIFDLHIYLQRKNIKHLFFNCMYNFVHTVYEPYNWSNQYIDPYNNDCSYYWYLKGKGLCTDAWYHYEADGHTVWAKYLINYIKENKLI
tara:strand:- start:55 stop:669 length:615 start_codon:yes stop_codon:yes gene_type:complete